MTQPSVECIRTYSGARQYSCAECKTLFMVTSGKHAAFYHLSCPHFWLSWVGSLFYAPPRPTEATRTFMDEKSRSAVMTVKIKDGTAYFTRRRRREG